MFNQIHDECGVFGIYAPDVEGAGANVDVASACYYGLFSLQHRGQESCGIVVNDEGVMSSYKDAGLVNDVFTKEVLHRLGHGRIAIGHVRYGASGTDPRLNAQPMLISHIHGVMALAFNGCLTNAPELREELEQGGSVFHTTSDLELIAGVIIKERLSSSSVEEAVVRSIPRLRGAFSIVAMSAKKLIAARDPLGFRPLCIGQIDKAVVFASESCALDSVGATLVRDIEPGEVVMVDEGGGMHSDRTHCSTGKKAICAFEFIYIARPDSVLDGSSVHSARMRAGSFLALEHPVQADVVIGVPDTGIDAAIGYSKQSGIPYDIGFIKSKYIGRTFIHPGQSQREDRVRIKLNVISQVVKGKRVVVIDDSIVRGTTTLRTVRLLKEAGAVEVHMRICSPPFTHLCHYGTDIDSPENLIANHHTTEEIAKILGADSLGYLNINHLCMLTESTHCGFCDACFTGDYPTEVPSAPVKYKYQQKCRRNDL